jgi:hypothetical protein
MDEAEHETSASTAIASNTASPWEVALSLIVAREAAGVSLSELCHRTGWSPRFVYKLESLNGQFANLTTIARYAHACGIDVGFLFSRPHAGGCLVVKSVTLQRCGRSGVFEQFTGARLLLSCSEKSNQNRE